MRSPTASVLLLTSLASQGFSFSLPVTSALETRSSTSQQNKLPHTKSMSALPETVAQAVSSSLSTGPYGVLGLTGVSSLVLLPLTQFKTLYGVSVGYGCSVAAIASMLWRHFSPAQGTLPYLLLTSATFYGIRLASFLLFREMTGLKPPVKESSRLSRIPFSISLALFFSCMTSPIMYALRNPTTVGTKLHTVAACGTYLSLFGAILEAIADYHKCLVKQKSTGSEFVGPSRGVYAFTRHPNYTGEILFWVGLFVAGLPSFDGPVAWSCSSLGLLGIISIMRSATAKLETRHAEKYGGQKKYEMWRSSTTPLIPFINSF